MSVKKTQTREREREQSIKLTYPKTTRELIDINPPLFIVLKGREHHYNIVAENRVYVSERSGTTRVLNEGAGKRK